MTQKEFHRLMRYYSAARKHRQFASRGAVVSRRSVKSVGNATGRTDLKRSSVISGQIDNIINTRITYAQCRH